MVLPVLSLNAQNAGTIYEISTVYTFQEKLVSGRLGCVVDTMLSLHHWNAHFLPPMCDPSPRYAGLDPSVPRHLTSHGTQYAPI